MSEWYQVDGLSLEVSDTFDELIVTHPLVSRCMSLAINKVRLRTEGLTGATTLYLRNNGCTRSLLISGLSARHLLIDLRALLLGIDMPYAAQLVDEFYQELVELLDDEKKARTMTTNRSSSRILTSDIEGLMEAVDMARSEIVPCLMGASGIGKTEGIESFARKHGRKVVHLIASQVLPTEVSGMTMPNQETHAMDVFDHSRISHMEDGDILFLDELLKGQQQVLSACLTMVQERRLMSGTPLPDVIIVAAANPLASPKMLPTEIRQRFMFVDVSFDGDSWCEYMRGRGIPHPENVVSRLVTNHEGGDWNVLTPRTATKLLLWLDGTKGTDAHAMVATVVRNMFDEAVLNGLTSCLADEAEVAKGSPMSQAVGRIRELMEDLPEADGSFETVMRNKASELLDDEGLSADPDKVAELLRLIGNMSGGSEILDALRNETVSLGGL